MLKKAKKRHLLPVTAFPINVLAGKYISRHYHLDFSASRLRASYEFSVAHRHANWAPTATVYFYDKKLDAKFGIAISQKKPGKVITIRPLASSPLRFKSFTLPLNDVIEIDCIWGESEKFHWRVNGREVLTVKSDLTPSAVKVYQVSGGGVFTLDVK